MNRSSCSYLHRQNKLCCLNTCCHIHHFWSLCRHNQIHFVYEAASRVFFLMSYASSINCYFDLVYSSVDTDVYFCESLALLIFKGEILLMVSLYFVIGYEGYGSILMNEYSSISEKQTIQQKCRKQFSWESHDKK